MAGTFDIDPFKPAGDIREIRPQLEALRKAVLALRPAPSGDIITRETASGMLYNLRKHGGGDSASPFQIDLDSDSGDATFYPGTINGLLPDNYSDGISVGSGLQYITLDCTANNGEITLATLTASGTPPPAIAPYAGQPPVAFSVLIYVVDDFVPYRIWGDGNIQAAGAESFRLQASVPVAGQLPYEVWYTWNLSVL